MESLFNFKDHRAYLSRKIKSYPKGGYGLIGKLAKSLGVHPSLVSQILKGEKTLTQDQAFLTAEFFGLTDLESDYFLLLVLIERAGNKKLKNHLERKLANLKDRSTHLVHRLNADQILSEEAKGVFYSDWTYTAIRQLTAIQGMETIEAISNATKIPAKDVRNIVDFLTKHGLCKQENGEFSIGPQSTHLPGSSPWVRVHHRNWRQRAIEQLRQNDPSTLFFTCPLTLGAGDVEKVKELAIKFIDEVYKVLDPSPSEELHCLNIDWFKVL